MNVFGLAPFSSRLFKAAIEWERARDLIRILRAAGKPITAADVQRVREAQRAFLSHSKQLREGNAR